VTRPRARQSGHRDLDADDRLHVLVTEGQWRAESRLDHDLGPDEERDLFLCCGGTGRGTTSCRTHRCGSER